MGISEYLSSTTDLLKRNAPDLTSVKNVCWTSYDYSCYGLGKIDNAVRVTAVDKIRNLRIPDGIYGFGQILAKNVAIEGIKSFPGGRWIYNVSDKTYHDYSKSISGAHNEKIKALTAEIVRLKKEKGSSIHSIDEQVETTKCVEESMSRRAIHSDSDFYQKPEDMIRIFMMKEFIGRDLFDDLIVPRVKSRRNPK